MSLVADWGRRRETRQAAPLRAVPLLAGACPRCHPGPGFCDIRHYLTEHNGKWPKGWQLAGEGVCSGPARI
jgi:hypothetical protein